VDAHGHLPDTEATADVGRSAGKRAEASSETMRTLGEIGTIRLFHLGSIEQQHWLRSGPRIGGRRPRERAELNEGGVGQITGENDGRGGKLRFGRSGPGQPAVEQARDERQRARRNSLHDGSTSGPLFRDEVAGLVATGRHRTRQEMSRPRRE